MTKSGKLHLGEDFIPEVEQLCQLLGTRKQSDAVRSVIVAVLEDAAQRKLTHVPRIALGIKDFVPVKKKKVVLGG